MISHTYSKYYLIKITTFVSISMCLSLELSIVLILLTILLFKLYCALKTQVSKVLPIILNYTHNCAFMDKVLYYKILAAFLEEKCNIFNKYNALEKVTNAFPIIIKIIKMILDYEQKPFFTSTGC